MFKIVQTLEEGSVVLTTVPESWEQNGILYWPPGRRAYTLRKNPSNLPDLSTWSRSKCIVKRDEIPTLQRALEEERQLSKFDDTEDEENFRLSKTVSRLHPVNKSILTMDDFNHLISTSTSSSTKTFDDLQNKRLQLEISNTKVADSDNAYFPEIGDVQSLSEDILNNKDAPEIDLSQADSFRILEEKVDTTLTNQETLIKSVAGLHAKFNKLLDMSMAVVNTATSANDQNYLNCNSIDELELFPINSTTKLDEVEIKLQNKDFQSIFVKKFSQIGGVDGKKSFHRLVYKVLDAIFDRTYLMEVSWTGSSKVKGKKKISMLQYKEIVSMFFKIINLADSRYTIEDNESFFKKVLKNSVSRANKTHSDVQPALAASEMEVVVGEHIDENLILNADVIIG